MFKDKEEVKKMKVEQQRRLKEFLEKYEKEKA